MKISKSHFEHYLNEENSISLHPSLLKIYNNFSDNLSELKNIIFYGPSNVGKYTQALTLIKKYSPSNLKYEKKITVNYNKDLYFFKISDIHYEVDMSLIGCHSKLLWNEIYNQITDILLSKSCKSGIILCKYYHEIHSELLDIFYSYMQTLNNPNIDIKYIIITENISFIPNNIVNCCQLISVEKPSKQKYKDCKNIKLQEISNIEKSNDNICDKIINIIKNIKVDSSNNTIINNNQTVLYKSNNIYYSIREHLYDIFIYNLNPQDCIWYIINSLIRDKNINEKNINEILMKTYTFLKYYNNNYRPIYHFEKFIIFLIIHIYDINNTTTIL